MASDTSSAQHPHTEFTPAEAKTLHGRSFLPKSVRDYLKVQDGAHKILIELVKLDRGGPELETVLRMVVWDGYLPEGQDTHVLSIRDVIELEPDMDRIKCFFELRSAQERVAEAELFAGSNI
jgi:hypothetical protein